MSRRNTPSKKSKFKQSIKNVLRRHFEKHPDSKFTHKQICQVLDIKENALRKLVYDIMQAQAKEGFLKSYGHGDFQYNQSANFVIGYLDAQTNADLVLFHVQKILSIYLLHRLMLDIVYPEIR